MIKSRLKKYSRLLRYALYLGKIKREDPNRTITRIGVLVSINPESAKFKLWHDGFTVAIEKLSADYEVNLIYFDDKQPEKLINQLNAHDFIIVKSSWRTAMDYFLRKNHQFIRPYLGLMISASNKGPKEAEQQFYDVVWYETLWYKSQSVHHNNAFHAFGIDTDIMKPSPYHDEKKYDYITVGAPRRYKRLEKLLSKPGKRLLIGDLKNRDRFTKNLLQRLTKDGVTIEDFQDYDTLAKKYNEAKICYIPCKVHGGGERSLLEARACGLDVEIEKDNPKLKELLVSPIWDGHYYYHQLKKGIDSVKV